MGGNMLLIACWLITSKIMKRIEAKISKLWIGLLFDSIYIIWVVLCKVANLNVVFTTACNYWCYRILTHEGVLLSSVWQVLEKPQRKEASLNLGAPWDLPLAPSVMCMMEGPPILLHKGPHTMPLPESGGVLILWVEATADRLHQAKGLLRDAGLRG